MRCECGRNSRLCHHSGTIAARTSRWSYVFIIRCVGTLVRPVSRIGIRRKEAHMTNFSIPILGPLAWIDVMLLIWFALTIVSVAYVAWDAFANNPEMTVMKWGWVLVTLYLGPISLVLYILSFKEPAPGTHE